MVPYLSPLCTTFLFQSRDNKGPLCHHLSRHDRMCRWNAPLRTRRTSASRDGRRRETAFSKRFQVVHAYHFGVLPDRLAPILVDLFNIQVLGFHVGRLIPHFKQRPAKSPCRFKYGRRPGVNAAHSCDRAGGENRQTSNNKAGLIVRVVQLHNSLDRSILTERLISALLGLRLTPLGSVMVIGATSQRPVFS